MLADPPDACLREAAIGNTRPVDDRIGVGLWYASLDAGRSNLDTDIVTDLREHPREQEKAGAIAVWM